MALKLFVYTMGLGRSSYPILIQSSESVGDLKKAILRNASDDFGNVNAHRLVLYRVNLVDGDGLEQRASQADLKEELKASSQLLSTIFPRAPEAGIVSIVVVAPETNDRKSNIETFLPELQLYDPVFAMKLGHQTFWTQLCTIDLDHSKVKCASSSPHLRDLQERLRRKRYIDNVTENLYALPGGTLAAPTFPNSYFEQVIPESNPPALDCVDKDELLHYAYLDLSTLRQISIFHRNKELHIRSFLLGFLARLSDNAYTWGFGSVLPFPLVVEVGESSGKPKENPLSYTPRPYFHMRIRDFPHILLEVNSQSNENDQYRMLLQASCIARIGNWLQDPASGSGKSVVIMAVYIKEDFKARQHLLCQPDINSSEVEYISNDFDLTVPLAVFEFIFQLYNFLSVAASDNASFGEPEEKLKIVKTMVERQQYQTLSSQSNTKRKCEGTENDSNRSRGPPTNGGAQGCFSNTSVLQELTTAGYAISEELMPLPPLKPTIREATSRHGVSVILKTIVDSNERQLLQDLRNIDSPLNHTIPLLDVIDLSIGKTIIVLPWKSTLDKALKFRRCPDDIVSLCIQFIEGVDFLHQHMVAHCDLKPGNVVVDTISESKTSPRLFIIDFDLAQRVESEETMMEGWCGTPPWIAPEVGSRDGPICRYNPILADRWACGLMIEHFAMYFPANEGTQKTKLLSFAKQLLNMDPRKRPGLKLLAAFHESTK